MTFGLVSSLINQKLILVRFEILSLSQAANI